MSTETYCIVDEFGVAYDKTQKGKDRLSFENSLYLVHKTRVWRKTDLKWSNDSITVHE
jgi:hypothetical protein